MICGAQTSVIMPKHLAMELKGTSGSQMTLSPSQTQQKKNLEFVDLKNTPFRVRIADVQQMLNQNKQLHLSSWLLIGRVVRVSMEPQRIDSPQQDNDSSLSSILMIDIEDETGEAQIELHQEQSAEIKGCTKGQIVAMFDVKWDPPENCAAGNLVSTKMMNINNIRGFLSADFVPLSNLCSLGIEDAKQDGKSDGFDIIICKAVVTNLRYPRSGIFLRKSHAICGHELEVW